MTPEGEKFDRFLNEAIGELKSKDGVMPEVGGKSIASEFRIGLLGIKKMAAELKLEVAGAVTEFITEAANIKEAASRMRGEAREMRAVAAEILGNEMASTPEKPTVDAPTAKQANGGAHGDVFSKNEVLSGLYERGQVAMANPDYPLGSGNEGEK